jgi:hypothetical protein
MGRADFRASAAQRVRALVTGALEKLRPGGRSDYVEMSSSFMEVPEGTGTSLNLDDVISRAREARPQQFGAVPDARSKALVRAALAEILKEVSAMQSDPVRIQGFGNFKARLGTRHRDGQEVIVKRIVFTPSTRD